LCSWSSGLSIAVIAARHRTFWTSGLREHVVANRLPTSVLKISDWRSSRRCGNLGLPTKPAVQEGSVNYLAILAEDLPPCKVTVRDADRVPHLGERVMLCNPDPSDPNAFPGVVYEVVGLTHVATANGPETLPGNTYLAIATHVHLRRLREEEVGPFLQIANVDR
jgi:hypothetical protein